ncbi:GNAT family N-acetyltransferase [Pararhodonellum marinum]|uniref:GNAT family N-acetyltransferase n=1 Tax=Pararhodonellum marinum TaxID=2755358 RepID=UPI00188FDFB2|nr:GNAT family N-acetyltransferase [Pararhodonellum marinum]
MNQFNTTNHRLNIHQWKEGEEVPIDLLLLADPSQRQIEIYLNQSQLFLATIEGNLVGVYVIMAINARAIEIKNVAVDPKWQGMGIGTALLRHAKETIKKKGFRMARIATADTSLNQLRLYKKLGFSELNRVKDYFLNHYPQPLYENGQQCRDQVILEMTL